MKLVKKIPLNLFAILIMASSFQCATQKLEKEAPANFQNVYFQQWSGGIRGAGSGTNLFIKLGKNETLNLDQVYFKGKVAKLENNKGDKSLYIARFNNPSKAEPTVSLDGTKNEADSNKETDGNKTSIPFELKDNECVVSYMEGEKMKYYKISNVKEKEAANYPSVRPQ